MDYSMMFHVQEGGVSTPIPWDKGALQPDRSIIILDESTLTLYLWHGIKQGLVARRTALRQAESLKGHGYTVGKSIIGRDIKQIVEIDARKVGRVPEETEKNTVLQEILNKQFRELDNYVITFSAGEVDPAMIKKKTPVAAASKPEPKPEPKVEPKPEPKPEPTPAAVAPKPVSAASTPAPAIKNEPTFASEYDTSDDMPIIKEDNPAATSPATPAAAESNLSEIRIALVIKAILDNYDDIWISKKNDGSYAVEMMDGPICQFSIKDAKINFTQNSFSGIDPSIKTKIQQKYIDLSKVLK
ncbi:MAG: hypothetical protein ACTSR8_03825 [Promethearchaeota archaeon]